MINTDCIQGMDFVNKFMEDYRKIESLGFKSNEILKMLSTQKYVRDFAQTPSFFVSAKKLPKGYKWADGEKYQLKAGKRNDSETYTFLIVGDDIYIKGFYAVWGFDVVEKDDEKIDGFSAKRYPLHKEFRNKICVIKNWKSMTPQYVLGKLDEVTVFFENSLTNFYAKNGGNFSMQNGPVVYQIVEKGLVVNE